MRKWFRDLFNKKGNKRKVYNLNELNRESLSSWYTDCMGSKEDKVQD